MPSVERAYGIIPVCLQGHLLQVLMVQHKDKEGKPMDYWSFPKGRADMGERMIQAGIRECFEETGIIIHEPQVRSDVTFEEKYRFFRDSELVLKTVYYHPAFIECVQKFSPKEDEIHKVRWMTIAAAFELVKQEQKRNVLREVKNWLEMESKREDSKTVGT